MAESFHLNLNDETVDHAWPKQPICVAPDSSVSDAMALLKQHRTGSVLVVRDEKLVGIFTERDALRMMAEGASFDTPISKVMIENVTSLSAGDSVGTAIAKMSAGKYRRLPIVDDSGKPVGLLTTTGILHYMVEHFQDVIYNLPPQPHHATQQREGA